MKIKRITSLMLLTALAWLVPKTATAAEYTFSAPTKAWSQAETTYSGRYYCIAVSGDDIYTLPAVSSDGVGMYSTYYTKGLKFSSSKVVAFSGGSGSYAFPYATSGSYYYLGPACASDSKGTFIAATRRAGAPSGLSWSNPPRAAAYYTSNPSSDNLSHTNPVAGSKEPINFTSTPISGRADKMSAYGDVANGTGYLWFIPGNQSNTYVGIERITTTSNATVTSKRQYKFPSELTSIGNNISRIMQYSDNGVLLDISGQNFYKGVISGDQTTITWTKLGVKAVSGSGAAMFVLAGHEILAYSSATTVVTLYDVTDGKVLHTFSPFSSASSTSNTRHAIDVRVSGNTASIYVLVPGQGAGKWTMTATEIQKTGAKVTNLGYSREYDKAGGYQTNTLTWTAPTGYSNTTLSSYNIYDGSTLIDTADASATSWTDSRQVTTAVTYKVVPIFDGIAETDTYSASIAVPVVDKQGAPVTNLKGAIAWDAETSTQTNTLTWTAPDEAAFVNTTLAGYKIYTGDISNGNYVEVDAALTSYNFGSVTAKTTYTVVPLFSGMEEKTGLGASVTIAKVSPVIPVINYVATFDGYNNVQVYWTAPSAASTPTYYEVWRDGVQVSKRKIVAFAHIETEVVEGSHYYEVKGVYTIDGTIDGEPAIVMTSAPWDFNVSARNMTYTKYAVENIYNYEIPQEGETATASMITDETLNKDLYDMNNYRQGAYYKGYWYIIQRAETAHYDSGNGIDYTADRTLTGNYATIYKVSATDPRSGWEKLITLEVNSTIGIAMDDEGNIFVRKNNREAIDATAPTGASPMASWMYDQFNRRITTGLIIKRNSDGSYDTANPITVDLKSLALGDMLPDTGTDNATYLSVRGRSDYYSATGNIATGTGYVYISPSWSTYVTRIKIVNGAYSGHEHYNIAEYKNWTNETKTLQLTSAENYVYPVDGRDDVVALLRSQAHMQVLNEHFTGATSDMVLPIQEVNSRTNTSGGTTIAFNNDLFMISPQSKFSRNLGDFIVMRASKTDVADINTADLNMTIPVWQYEQSEASNALVTNANGNWIFAEEGTWTIDGQEKPCVYIYQYVPGIRIAKYRLYPLTQFPYPPVTLDISTGYECDGSDNPIDITHFDGLVTWSKPAEYNYVEDQSTYRLVSYHLEILDNTGAVIDQVEVPHVEGTNDYSYDYAGTELLDDNLNYTARIYATYEDIDGHKYISDKNNAVDIHQYTPAPPVVENVNAYIHSGLWDNDVYRVELNFDRPTETTEPVSYYSVYAKMPTGETVQITDFNLMVDGVENENIVDGVALLWDSIPGTYDFNANEAAWHAGLPEASPNKSTLVWYHTVEMGHYTHSSSIARATANDPSTWTYYVVANYASTNAKLVTAEEASKTTDSDLIITGVEAVSAEVTGMLKVFPNPAHSVVNIQSVVAIETVALYNEAGAEVLNAAGNGENAMQLDVESLADGVYFLRVNNLPPVKIVKN
ncbi:MAG: T9SS type A sorting domain-containing protein [Muribaculaceae bacterium]|nr:T9SS type A sorting domain-containing protein [Muribaculaceae bacterium]